MAYVIWLQLPLKGAFYHSIAENVWILARGGVSDVSLLFLHSLFADKGFEEPDMKQDSV